MENDVKFDRFYKIFKCIFFGAVIIAAAFIIRPQKQKDYAYEFVPYKFALNEVVVGFVVDKKTGKPKPVDVNGKVVKYYY